MAVIKLAFTMPVNGDAQASILTREEVYAGLVLIAREPQKFTTTITHCDLHVDTDTLVKRTTHFQEGMGPPSLQAEHEVILEKNYKTTIIAPETGNIGINYISEGFGSDPNSLYLSQMYEIPLGNVVPGSPEEDAMKAKYTMFGKRNLTEGLELIRRVKVERSL